MNLFGKAKAAKVSPKEAIAKLRETAEMLEKREKHLQSKIDGELQTARANATKNRRAALMALKRKKQYENEINKISGARMTIDTQMMAIENVNVNFEALNAMKAGAEAMKAIHGAMDINKVDSTMDDIREQMDLANEISDAISQPVGFGVDMDEDELNAELEQMEQEELDSKILDAGTPAVSLPSVPSTAVPVAARPVKVQDDEDAELAELKASMAM